MTEEVKKFVEANEEDTIFMEISFTNRDLVEIAESVEGAKVIVFSDPKGDEYLSVSKEGKITQLADFVDAVSSFVLKEIIKLKIKQLEKAEPVNK